MSTIYVATKQMSNTSCANTSGVNKFMGNKHLQEFISINSIHKIGQPIMRQQRTTTNSVKELCKQARRQQMSPHQNMATKSTANRSGQPITSASYVDKFYLQTTSTNSGSTNHLSTNRVSSNYMATNSA